MTEAALAYRWSASEFVRAFEAGVFEVSDETVIQDLNIKTRLYGSAGYPVYWVITPERVFEYTGPTPSGYRTRVEYGRGERIPVGYAGVDLAIDDLL